MFSNFGGLVQAVGAAWLMTLIAASDTQVALVQATTTLPVMVFALFSGAVADSYNRRTVMLAAQAFMFVVGCILVLVTWMDWINAWSLLALTFLIGCGVAFNNPAWQASVRDFVGMDLLPRAVLLNGVGFTVTRSVAPAMGRIIVATFGAVAAFAINALSYLGVLWAIWSWAGPPPQASRQRESLGSAIRAGVRYVQMSPHLRRLYVRGAVFGTGAIAMMALMPLIARDLLAGDSLTFGLLLGAFGAGAVVSGLSSERMAQKYSSEQMIRLSFLALMAAISVASISPWVWLSMLATALSGWAWVLALALLNTTVQLSTPRWVVGRAMAFYQMFTFGGMAFGSWVWGVAVDSYSLPAAMQLSTVALAVGLLMGLVWPMPSRRDLDLDPLGRWQEPEVQLDIVPRSGPVSVAIEYQIEEGDVGEFQALMRERRRVRRRDGARQWTLLRNLENPQQWIERFELPTWADYVRFHTRPTQEDGKLFDRIRSLHSGPEKPRVRRMLVRDPGEMRLPVEGSIDLA